MSLDQKVPENFVKMCKEAKEMQNSWIPGRSDYVYDKYGKYWAGSCVYVLGNEWAWVEGNEDFNEYRKQYEVIWLPTQRQLQEILWRFLKKEWKADEEFKLDSLFIAFRNYVSEFGGSPLRRFTTFEETWLELVMYKVFGKVWDEESKRWIPCSRSAKRGTLGSANFCANSLEL